MQNRSEIVLGLVVGLTGLGLLFEVHLLFIIAFGIGIVSILSGKVADIIAKLWLKIGEGLGWINARIILSAIYWILLFPLSLLNKAKLRKKHFLNKPAAGSTFIARNHTYSSEDLKNPW